MTSTAQGTLRVLEFAQGFAGPSCGRIFAALGHEVIKCEPSDGDYLRAGSRGDGSAGSFAFDHLNAGKRSVVVDLDSAPGIAAAQELIDSADLVICDLAPDMVVRLGLVGDGRSQRWPELVVVSITGFGLDSPWSRHRPDSLLAEAYGGLATMIGEPDREPLSLGGEQAAYASGFVGFFGAMIGLESARRGRGGGLVEVALSDVAAYVDWKSDINFHQDGRVPVRSGTQHGRWRVLPTSDGWVGIIYQPEQWQALVDLVGHPALEDPALADEAVRDGRVETWWPVIARWAREKSCREIYGEAQSVGLAFGISTDIADLSQSDQLRARNFIPDGSQRDAPVGGLFVSEELGWGSGPVPALGEYVQAPASTPAADSRPSGGRERSAPAPLEGMVVLDLGMITAGAAVGRLLSDYGATVIKVESPTRPDAFRQWTSPDRSEDAGDAPVFDSNNAGKYGLTLDLKTTADRSVFSALARKAHVVIENFRVGVPERLGVDYETLRALNPSLIYLSLSSQGQFGPESASRSYGSTLDMLSGLASVTGYPGGPPMWSSVDVNYPDQLVSLLGAGIVAYCWNRGIGTHIDISQREVVSWTLADLIVRHRMTGEVPHATGNSRPFSFPHGVFACAGEDRWVAVACFDDLQRSALSRMVAPNSASAGDSDDVDGLEQSLSRWTGQRSPAQCAAELDAAGIPCAPVLSADDRAADPHFDRRRVFLNAPLRRKGYPLVVEGFVPQVLRPAPAVGEHNERILVALRECAAGAIDPEEPVLPGEG